MKLADECWVALALLQKSQPRRTSFGVNEIIQRMKAEHAHPELRAGARTHIHQHLVANAPPDTGRYRLFYRLPDGTFRLFRPGDQYDPRRTGKTKPAREDLPVRYGPLLDWYEHKYAPAPRGETNRPQPDPFLSLRGVGRGLWADQDPVEYVRTLRRGWSVDGDDARPVPDSSPRQAGRRAG